jgi:adenosylhomocysteinase
MDGFQVARLDDVAGDVDILITGTGNTRVVTTENLRALKHLAIVGNVGTSTTRSTSPVSRRSRRREGRDQAAGARVPDAWRHGILVLSEGRLLNLGNATGHPSFVMSASFTNQVLAQLELYTSAEYPVGVYVLPKISTRRSPACTSMPWACV